MRALARPPPTAAARSPDGSLAVTPSVVDFGKVSLGAASVAEFALVNETATAVRFRLADRSLLGVHPPQGNSVRVRFDGGPLEPGSSRLFHVTLMGRDVGRFAQSLTIVTERGDVSVSVNALITS